MESSAEQLIVNIFAQMPFVALIYYMYRGERDERLNAQKNLIESLRTTIQKNEERHISAYERACSLYERALDQAAEQVKLERRRRNASTDLTGEHPTQPKVGL
jgi:DNA-binding transcriptional regulator GbsR (MarR family)